MRDASSQQPRIQIRTVMAARILFHWLRALSVADHDDVAGAVRLACLVADAQDLGARDFRVGVKRSGNPFPQPARLLRWAWLRGRRRARLDLPAEHHAMLLAGKAGGRHFLRLVHPAV